MPNHITNVILASPEVADAITRHHTEEEIAENRKRYAESQVRYKERTGNDWPYPPDDMTERIVDFAMVIPEPANMFHGGCNDQHPHRDEAGRELVCWYGWNVQNWGTKWNGYDTTVTPAPGDLCEVRFDTAWSHPVPVIEALSEKFPDEVIEVAYADEDFGSNCGRYKIKGGETFDEFIPEYGKASRELAADVKYGRPLEELEAEWDQDEIDSARRSAFCKRIEAQRGIDNGYKVIQDEGLEVPDDIVAAIATKEQADAYWNEELTA